MVDRWMGIDVEREGDADNKSNAVARGKRGGKKEAEKQESPCLALLVLCFRGSATHTSRIVGRYILVSVATNSSNF